MQKEIFVFIQLLHDYWIKKNKRNIIDKSYAKNSAPLHDKIVFRLTNVNRYEWRIFKNDRKRELNIKVIKI